MKSHLPSLYQKQESKNMHTGFVDLSYKMSLINKGRVTVTTIELNEIIKELYDIYQSDLEMQSKMDQLLQLKKNIFSGEVERFNKVQTNYNILKSNTSFLGALKKKNLKFQISELIQSITEIDLDRQAQHPPPMSVDPLSVINKEEADIPKFLHLKELNYRELEALIYLLKKRVLTVDKSDECIGMVNKEYNSLSNLVNYAKSLAEENKQLKNFEKLYIQDPLTKRQLFSQLPQYGNVSMIIILQSAIQSIYQHSKILHTPLPMNEGQNFESICPDQEFKQKELSFKTESTDHNLVSLEEAFEQAQNQYNKMNSSDALKCCLLPKNFLNIQNSPLDKLIKSNADILTNIRNTHLRYENAIKGIFDTTKQIMDELSEKRKFECFSSSNVFKLIDLNNDHIELIKKQYNNYEKLNVLEKCISTFGISLISQPNQIIKDAVKRYLNLEPSSNSPPDKKKRKQSVLNFNVSSEIQNCSNESLDLLCNQSTNVLLSGLETALQITDFKQSKPKTNYATNLKSFLSELKNSFSTSISNMDDYLKNQIDILKAANALNLRKTLIDTEVEVNLTEKEDKCTQTEEIINKKK